jgi:uncharacterized membrane protein (DUF4010 family)
MDVIPLFQKFGLALGLGLLVGLQRERTASSMAGFRTFPLVTLLGTLAGVLSGGGNWVLAAAGLVGIAGLCVMSNIVKLKAGEPDPGLTTEAALMVMYSLGVFLAVGPAPVAVVIGAVVAFLLYLKPVLHGFARKLGEEDFRGIMQFAAIALIILPLVPNVSFGPFGVLNPRKIWMLVVLITGISLAGYLLSKFWSAQSSTLLAGVLGGLVSSTATTVSFARRTRESAKAVQGATLVILLSGTVVFARVLVLVGVTAPGHFVAIAPPLGCMLGAMLLICTAVWLRQRKEKAELPPQKNPTELRAALVFTLLFAGVLVAVAAAREYLGERGLYVVAGLSGLTDMDAITVSSAEMAHHGGVSPGIAWRLILVASLANIVFKTAMVATLGAPALLRRVALGFGVAAAAGGALMLLWPW